MNKYILASVGTLELYSQDGTFLMSSKSILNETFTFSSVENLVRGGNLNGILGSYFTNADMNIELTDVLFDMSSLALCTGADIQTVGNYLDVEVVTADEDGNLNVSETPVDINGWGTIGWCHKNGNRNQKWHKVSFDGTVGTSDIVKPNLTYCVKYMRESYDVDEITINSNFVPRECYAILNLPIFDSSENKSVSTNTQAGFVQIIIPTLQILGETTLTLSSDGHSDIPLKARAMQTYDKDSCNSYGYYAKVLRVIKDTTHNDRLDDVEYIQIEADENIAVNSVTKLKLVAIRDGIRQSGYISTDDFVFTVSNEDGNTLSLTQNGMLLLGEATKTGEYVISCIHKTEERLVASITLRVFDTVTLVWDNALSYDDNGNAVELGVWEDE